MAKFIALKTGFLGKGRVREGQVFDWNGPVGSWMKPLEAEPVVEPEEELKPVRSRKKHKEEEVIDSAEPVSNQEVI